MKLHQKEINQEYNNMTNELKKIWGLVINLNSKYFINPKKMHEIYLTNALCGECGELANKAKHRHNGGSKITNDTDEDVLFELCDIFAYMVMLCIKLNVDYSDFFIMFKEKNKIVEKRMINRDTKDNKP